MIVYRCDLCDEVRDCAQREIDHTEFDICSECWNSLRSKLKGKGRFTRNNEIVALPTSPRPESPREPKPSPFPGTPPTIYANADPVN
jgi:hypothetical protein